MKPESFDEIRPRTIVKLYGSRKKTRKEMKHRGFHKIRVEYKREGVETLVSQKVLRTIIQKH